MPADKPGLRPVKLVCGLLFNKAVELDAVDFRLSSLLGPVDLRSEIFDFKFTRYYNDEMGDNLAKRFYSFQNLVMPDDLPDIKTSTIEIEAEYACDGRRRINIDPGYLEESKLVLASTKNFSHRIYLRDNIWAEVTMRFSHGEFVRHEWTYPDWSQPLGMDFLKQARDIYRSQLGSAEI